MCGQAEYRQLTFKVNRHKAQKSKANEIHKIQRIIVCNTPETHASQFLRIRNPAGNIQYIGKQMN